MSSYTTQNVVVTQSGTGFLIDVTAANLDDSPMIRDFVVLQGQPAVVVPTTSYIKVSGTTLQYTGPSLPANTRIEIRRRTQYAPYTLAQYWTHLSSSDYNHELERQARLNYELDTNGVGSVGNLSGEIRDGAFGADWFTDALNGASRKAIANQFAGLRTVVDNNQLDLDTRKFDKNGGTVSGTLTLTGALAVGGNTTISGTLQTGGHVTIPSVGVSTNAAINGTLNVVGVGTFSNNLNVNGTLRLPNAPAANATGTIVPSIDWLNTALLNGNFELRNSVAVSPSSDSNYVATTAWTRQHLANAPALGAVTLTAPPLSDNSNRGISSAFLRSFLASAPNLTNPTANTPAQGVNGTELVTANWVNQRAAAWVETRGVVARANGNQGVILTPNAWSLLSATWTPSKGWIDGNGAFVAPATGHYRITFVVLTYVEFGTPSLVFFGVGAAVAGNINDQGIRLPGHNYGFSTSFVIPAVAGQTIAPVYFLANASAGRLETSGYTLTYEYLGS